MRSAATVCRNIAGATARSRERPTMHRRERMGGTRSRTASAPRIGGVAATRPACWSCVRSFLPLAPPRATALAVLGTADLDQQVVDDAANVRDCLYRQSEHLFVRFGTDGPP